MYVNWDAHLYQLALNAHLLAMSRCRLSLRLMTPAKCYDGCSNKGSA